MNKKILSIIAFLVIIFVSVLFVFSLTTNKNEEIDIKTGQAMASNEISSRYLTIGGVKYEYRSKALATATTTPCAFASPSATSTLVRAGFTIKTATSTATTWTIARAATAFATTTPLMADVTLSSGALGTVSVASTTPTINSVSVFSPNTYLVIGVAGTASADTTKLNGSCVAEFMVI